MPRSQLKKYRLLWKPTKVPTHVLFAIAVLAGVLYMGVNFFKSARPKRDYSLKMQASQNTAKAFALIKAAREAKGFPIDPSLDPTKSGMIGLPSSITSTKSGDIKAKQASVNPEWAAVFIDMFREANLQAGDAVAIGMSGSFPALNAAALIAAETFGLRPLVISSVGASTYGANLPDFTWLDMEDILFRNGFISQRSLAVSFGGKKDLGLGLSPEARKKIMASIEQSHLPILSGEEKSDLIRKRIQIYLKKSEPAGVRAYMNIGGGIASVGSSRAKHLFRPGINTTIGEIEDGSFDGGVMAYFQSEGLPILHIIRTRELARKYGLDESPSSPVEIGKSRVFQDYSYSRFGAFTAVLIILTAVGLATYLRVESAAELEAGTVAKSSTTTASRLFN